MRNKGAELRVLYVSPAPPPPVPGTDGLFTEIGYLRNSFGGNLISLSPFRSLPPIVPVHLFGIHHLFALKKYERNVDIIHLFFPYLVDFHILRYFSKPIIYTVTSGVEYSKLPGTRPPCTVVVSSEDEADTLKSWGMVDVCIIRPGVDPSHIKVTPPLGADKDFTILMGSAPWINSQFSSKGFDLMLEVMKRLPWVRLICLWRGRLYYEWAKKIRVSGLTDRVEIINEKTDISRVLSRCHAAMVLAERADLVKSYPNSLMESLVAGKPVLVSGAVPMASYVETTGCGNVINSFSVDRTIDAINEMKSNYSRFRESALLIGKNGFSEARMVYDYRKLYQELMKGF